MRVLDVYAGKENKLEAQFPGAEVVHENIVDLDRAFRSGVYDVVYCAHALPTVERTMVPTKVEIMKACLVTGGELWIITPSAEWAAGQVLAQEPNPLAQMVLYGFDANYHSMYTLLWLRALVESAGMITRKAFQGPWTININGEEVTLPQNVVIAMRYDRDPVPEPAPVTANALV